MLEFKIFIGRFSFLTISKNKTAHRNAVSGSMPDFYNVSIESVVGLFLKVINDESRLSPYFLLFLGIFGDFYQYFPLKSALACSKEHSQAPLQSC